MVAVWTVPDPRCLTSHWRVPRGHQLPRAATRRGFLIGGGLSLAAILAACQDGSESASGPSGDGGPAFPVRIAHKYGETEVPARPERVITVGLTEQDYVLALGVAPVGVREWFGGHPGALWPWAQEALAGLDGAPTPEVLPVEELDFEQVAALEPDLILGVNSGLTEGDYGKLAELAPTIAQPKDYPDYGAPWQTITRTVGRALGQIEAAEALIPDIEARFEQARAEHPGFAGATGLIVGSIDGTAYIYPEGPGPGLLAALGFEWPAAAADLIPADRQPVQLSPEQLEVLEADVVVLEVYGDESTSIREQAVYQGLDVVKYGREVVLAEHSVTNGALTFGSVLSLPVALDELVPRLAAASDGAPATVVAPAS